MIFQRGTKDTTLDISYESYVGLLNKGLSLSIDSTIH